MMLAEPRPDLDRVLLGSFWDGGVHRGPLRLLSWNIERGEQFKGVVAFIRRHNPTVCLIQEADMNARRTGRRDITGAIALELNYNFAYGIEFQELAQGTEASPAFVGNACLARSPVPEARVFRFKRQTDAWKPAWWKPGFMQPRLGGRMALAAEVEWEGTRLAAYSVHLESQFPEERRREQLREILQDARRYPPSVPVVIAGDYNTRLRPTPLLADLRAAQFRNALGEDCLNTKRDGSGSQDWIFVRGPVRASAGRVHTEERSADHFPLSVELVLS
jgi:endonuclease/exonuclease/phosphatase family metal-dependent hydrolase